MGRYEFYNYIVNNFDSIYPIVILSLISLKESKFNSQIQYNYLKTKSFKTNIFMTQIKS